jgi:hypothetical protein
MTASYYAQAFAPLPGRGGRVGELLDVDVADAAGGAPRTSPAGARGAELRPLGGPGRRRRPVLLEPGRVPGRGPGPPRRGVWRRSAAEPGQQQAIPRLGRIADRGPRRRAHRRRRGPRPSGGPGITRSRLRVSPAGLVVGSCAPAGSPAAPATASTASVLLPGQPGGKPCRRSTHGRSDRRNPRRPVHVALPPRSALAGHTPALKSCLGGGTRGGRRLSVQLVNEPLPVLPEYALAHRGLREHRRPGGGQGPDLRISEDFGYGAAVSAMLDWLNENGHAELVRNAVAMINAVREEDLLGGCVPVGTWCVGRRWRGVWPGGSGGAGLRARPSCCRGPCPGFRAGRRRGGPGRSRCPSTAVRSAPSSRPWPRPPGTRARASCVGATGS